MDFAVGCSCEVSWGGVLWGVAVLCKAIAWLRAVKAVDGGGLLWEGQGSGADVCGPEFRVFGVNRVPRVWGDEGDACALFSRDGCSGEQALCTAVEGGYV